MVPPHNLHDQPLLQVRSTEQTLPCFLWLYFCPVSRYDIVRLVVYVYMYMHMQLYVNFDMRV